LIVPIGRWVLRTACAQVSEWRATGRGPQRVAVNISVLQFLQADLPALIAHFIDEAGIPADALELEITESVLANDADGAVRTLRALKALGARIAIDDFGTGYSSLSYLKRFPVDKLKVDRSFVRGIASDPDDEAIVSAIIALARSLRLRVVAEGVEDEAQLRALREQGCDEIQGYLLSRPVEPEALALRFWSEQSAGRASG
jgi:EAL domain-containing protein (putative c-di-GMP-specific phosphodiesterase class I)